MKKTLYLILAAAMMAACSPLSFQQKWLSEKAPEKFHAVFQTTKGNFEIVSERQWSPLGVDRFYQMIKRGYFNDLPVYRVEPDYVMQFGALDTVHSNRAWFEEFADEPVLRSNTNGSIAFASSGKDTRSNQLYINMKNNTKLDTLNFNGQKGFPVVAIITKGLDHTRKFHLYTEGLQFPDSARTDPIAYLRRAYPKLDYIMSAKIIK